MSPMAHADYILINLQFYLKSFFKPERIPFELFVDDVDVLSEEEVVAEVVVPEEVVSDEETAAPLLIFAPSIIPSYASKTEPKVPIVCEIVDICFFSSDEASLEKYEVSFFIRASS